MSDNNTFLAVFLGGKTSPQMTAWDKLSEADKQKKTHEGMEAWTGWCQKHADKIVAMGGPLGATKKISGHGIEDASNALCAYTIVHANSHEEAARLFEKHPHFTIFPGESIEVMPILPVPGA